MDENRLDRIEKMLEGLTQTVELVAGMQKKNEEGLDKLLRSVKAMERVAMKSAADFHIRLLALEEGEANG